MILVLLSGLGVRKWWFWCL